MSEDSKAEATRLRLLRTVAEDAVALATSVVFGSVAAFALALTGMVALEKLSERALAVIGSASLVAFAVGVVFDTAGTRLCCNRRGALGGRVWKSLRPML